MDVSIEEVATEDVEEDVDEVEKYTAEEVVEEAAAHMKVELKSQTSTVTLDIQSGSQSQTIQGKGSMRTRCTKISWRIK